MSRSFRKTPIVGNTTAHSEKWDKKQWHQRHRKAVRQRLSTTDDLDDYVDVDIRESSNPWSMNKDGRHYMTGFSRWNNEKYDITKYMRK
jgi:hypothetical protein